MFKRILSRIRRYKFQANGYSEVTGEFGKYYTKKGSNTVLFIPESYGQKIPKKVATTVAEIVGNMED